MNGISYIIPVCNTDNIIFEQRVENLNIIFDKYLSQQKGIEFEIIMHEQIINKELPTFASRINNKQVIKEQHAYGDIFNKPFILNGAVINIAQYDTLVFAEADCYIHDNPNYLSNWYQDFNDKGLIWGFLWDRMVWTTKEVKEEFIKNNRLNPAKCRIFPLGVSIGSAAEGGIIGVNRKFFMDVGGFYEKMDGLGGIDNYFCLKLRSVTNSYPIFKHMMWHLQHDLSYMKDRKLRKRNSDIYKEAKRNPMIAIQRDVELLKNRG